MKKQIRSFVWMVCIGLFPVALVSAQQDPLYSLYLNNPIMINPAYTGLNNNFNANVGFRKQWTGFEGSPSTMSFSAHSSLPQNKMAAGLVIVNDRIGENSTTQVTGTYAYKLEIDRDHTLSFGMQAGFLNYKTDPGKLNLQDPGDPVFGAVNQLKPIIGAGIILKSERYMIGLSVPRLLNSSFNVGGQQFKAYQEHYYLFGAYILNLSARIQFKPAVLLKAVSGAPISTDLNLNFIVDRNYTVGLYTRNLNSYGVLTQLNFMNYYRLAYAFEVPTKNSVGTRYSTNEINLGIKLSVLKFQNRSTTNF